jgi:hypothetical protein
LDEGRGTALRLGQERCHLRLSCSRGRGLLLGRLTARNKKTSQAFDDLLTSMGDGAQ